MQRIAPVSGPKLDVRDLQVVLALATAKSTAAAAPMLHLTQSAVSRALVLAEEKLGVRLFDRTSRGLAPTAAGERLLQGASSLLSQLADLEQSAASPNAEITKIRVVCECYTAYRWLPSVVANLRVTQPSLEITLAMNSTHDPVSALLAGDVDVALLTTATTRAGLMQRPLFSDEVVFVVGASHPLAKRPSIRVKDLLENTVIASSSTPPSETRWLMNEVFGRKRPKLDVIQFPLTEAIIDAARANMGIAILSEWIASGYMGDGRLVAKSFSTRALRRPWRIAFRRESTRAAERLAAVLSSRAQT